MWSSLGITASYVRLRTFYAAQSFEYTIFGKQYPPTNAKYTLSFFQASNLLVSSYMSGPQEELHRQDSKEPPPLMSQWWAVAGQVYIMWCETFGRLAKPAPHLAKRGMVPPPRNFLQVFPDDQTMSVVELAMKKIGRSGEKPRWPGVTFTSDGDDFKAILASPSVATFAWFIIMHKYNFGINQVDNLTVFWVDSPKYGLVPNIVQRVSRVQRNKVLPGKDAEMADASAQCQC
jgi:hypothetical protein